MAGSLNHITNGDGTFTIDRIDGMRDAHEALVECHQIIAELLIRGGDEALNWANKEEVITDICESLGFPDAAAPVIQSELHGYDSVYKKPKNKGLDDEFIIWSRTQEGWVGHIGNITSRIEGARRFRRLNAQKRVDRSPDEFVLVLAPQVKS